MPKGFKIHPPIAEKLGVWKYPRTLGHPVAIRAISLRKRQNIKANRATMAIRDLKVYKEAEPRLTQLPRQENLPSSGNDEGATRDKISKVSGLTWPPEPSNYIVIVGQRQIFDINLNIIQLHCMSAS